MKPIIRLDAKPDDLETIERYNKAREEEHERKYEAEMKIYNSPEEVAKREKEAKEFQEEERKRVDKMWEEDRIKAMNDLIDNPAGQFTYDDRVVVSNPIKCGGCGDHAEYEGKQGLVKRQNGCRCLHEISDNCYWIMMDGTGETHNFEECELTKVTQ